AHADLDRLYRPFTTPIQWLLNRRAHRDANHLKVLLEPEGRHREDARRPADGEPWRCEDGEVGAGLSSAVL
ncbi:MAG: hypothetical protein ACN4GZ_19650, partial [Acidimicrobiales bacterium]